MTSPAEPSDAWTGAWQRAIDPAPRGLRSAALLPDPLLSLSSCVCPAQSRGALRVVASIGAEDAALLLAEADFETPLTEALREAAPRGGRLLGYELLSVESGAFAHSWLCIGLENRAHFDHGIDPGPYGLLKTATEAELLLRLIRDGVVPAEPGRWIIARLSEA